MMHFELLDRPDRGDDGNVRFLTGSKNIAFS